MSLILELIGPFKLTQKNFDTQVTLNQQGIFVLFEEQKSIIQPIYADSSANIENGIKLAQSSYPNATHFGYQNTSTSDRLNLLTLALEKYKW